MKILHLGIDSPFVDYLVAGFERHAPGANELVVVAGAEPSARPEAFHGPWSWVRPVAEEVHRLRTRAGDSDVVVVHAMSEFAGIVCAELPPTTILVWSGFGYDYYVGEAAAGLAGRATLRLMRGLGWVPDTSGRFVPPPKLKMLEPLAFDLVRRQVARRTDFLSTPVDADRDAFRAAFPDFDGEYRQLNYADLTSMCPAGDAVVTGQDVLVGNSSSWSSNHVEAFQLLAGCDLGERRVVVPLTYGDPAYRDAVIEVGERLLGDRFTPIVDHLPLTEYLDLIRGCRVALFYHRRQQAIGNIVAALQQGSHVYLHRKNPLFGWFRARGVEVETARELRQGLPSTDVLPEVLARHRAALAAAWGAERVETNLRDFVGELESRVRASGQRARRPRGFRARRRR